MKGQVKMNEMVIKRCQPVSKLTASIFTQHRNGERSGDQRNSVRSAFECSRSPAGKANNGKLKPCQVVCKIDVLTGSRTNRRVQITTSPYNARDPLAMAHIRADLAKKARSVCSRLVEAFLFCSSIASQSKIVSLSGGD